MSGVLIRAAGRGDVAAVYAIALQTGDHGADATAIYEDPDLMGHLYAGPYLALEPERAFVAEDDEGVVGYVVGAAETRAFEAAQNARWWPALRRRYEKPEGDPSRWSADAARIARFFDPRRAPDWVVEAYPAHLHMNIAARVRRRGIGSGLLGCWIEAARAAGVTAAHVAVSLRNPGGLAFWSAEGFARLAPPNDAAADPVAVYCGRAL